MAFWPPKSKTMSGAPARETLRFGRFVLDVSAYELRRNGRRVRLERQPMDLLILLVTRRGELIPRDEIITRLWSKDVFIDVETGVNTAIRKIRQALNDSPEAAAFIETVTGKGYRFVAQVEVITAAPVAASIMLAVLPFVNVSGDEDREYLADGLTEETIASLSQLDPEHLSVIGHRSAMSYKATTKTLETIGSELKVHFVVDGAIRIEGSWCRVRCTLSRVRDQVQLWSHSYDCDASNLLGLQRDLSGAIAGHVRPHLTPERLDSIPLRHSRDAAAHDLYLRGRRYWNQLTSVTTRMAIDYYRRATEIDPGYSLAWAGLAEAFASAPINGDGEPQVMGPLAREAAEHAIQANAGLSEAQHVHGQVTWFFKWDFLGAVAFFRQAVALDPSNAWAHSMLGHTLSQMRRHEEAAFQMERACTLEPLSPLHHAMASQVAFQACDFRAAAARARRAIAIDPEFWVGHMMLGQAYQQIGETELALDALGRAARLSGGNSKPMSLRAYVLARAGQAAAARDVLEALEDAARSTYVPPYAMALICSGLADADATFAWLERAFAVRDVHLVFLPVDPKWDGWRDEARFRALLDRCGFDSSTRAPNA
jgi:TolB-like protein/cytochrome c-type biogenesis protein CcmH/NrfG